MLFLCAAIVALRACLDLLDRPEILDFLRFVAHILHVRCATILKNQGFLIQPRIF